MAYKRRTSKSIEQAQVRATNLEAIGLALDLGNGLTVAAFRAEIEATQALLDTYNIKLAEADAALNALSAQEKQLKTLNGRMLAAVGAVYGKDSSEYEQAGGTRTSEIDWRPPSPSS